VITRASSTGLLLCRLNGWLYSWRLSVPLWGPHVWLLRQSHTPEVMSQSRSFARPLWCGLCFVCCCFPLQGHAVLHFKLCVVVARQCWSSSACSLSVYLWGKHGSSSPAPTTHTFHHISACTCTQHKPCCYKRVLFWYSLFPEFKVHHVPSESVCPKGLEDWSGAWRAHCCCLAGQQVKLLYLRQPSPCQVLPLWFYCYTRPMFRATGCGVCPPFGAGLRLTKCHPASYTFHVISRLLLCWWVRGFMLCTFHCAGSCRTASFTSCATYVGWALSSVIHECSFPHTVLSSRQRNMLSCWFLFFCHCPLFLMGAWDVATWCWFPRYNAG